MEVAVEARARKLVNGLPTLAWDNNDYALLWAVCKNGKVVDFTIKPTYLVIFP